MTAAGDTPEWCPEPRKRSYPTRPAAEAAARSGEVAYGCWHGRSKWHWHLRRARVFVITEGDARRRLDKARAELNRARARPVWVRDRDGTMRRVDKAAGDTSTTKRKVR